MGIFCAINWSYFDQNMAQKIPIVLESRPTTHDKFAIMYIWVGNLCKLLQCESVSIIIFIDTQ